MKEIFFCIIKNLIRAEYFYSLFKPNIHLLARIISTVDVDVTFTSNRPCKEPLSPYKAMEYILII